MNSSVIFSLATVIMLLTTSVGLNATETNSHRQQVETLFRLTQMEKKTQESMESILQLQLRQNPGLIHHEDRMRAFFNKYIGWTALKNDIANMYMHTFTEKELKQINDFYITPTGQKVLNELPQLVQQRNQLAMQRLQQNISELHQIIGPSGNQPPRP